MISFLRNKRNLLAALGLVPASVYGFKVYEYNNLFRSRNKLCNDLKKTNDKVRSDRENITETWSKPDIKKRIVVGLPPSELRYDQRYDQSRELRSFPEIITDSPLYHSLLWPLGYDTYKLNSIKYELIVLSYTFGLHKDEQFELFIEGLEGHSHLDHEKGHSTLKFEQDHEKLFLWRKKISYELKCAEDGSYDERFVMTLG